MKKSQNENTLAQAIINGDRQAFKSFFDTYHHMLLGYALTLTHDREQAKDIVQMSFVSLWKKRKNLQPIGFKQLLFTTAKNLYIDHYRSKVSRANLYAELALQAIQHENEDDEHIENQILKLRKCINKLPERCQEILRMTKLEGLTQQEVADYLEISVRTVEAQIRLAYQKIRDIFDSEDPMILFVLLRALLR